MKWILVLILLVTPTQVFSQAFNFAYRYKEVCSDQLKTVNVAFERQGNLFSASFFGEVKTFNQQQIGNGEFLIWLNETYKAWTEYYPCSEIKAIVEDAAKKAAQGNEIDIGQPLLVVSSDLAYTYPGVYKIGTGYTSEDRLTGKKFGGLGNLGTSKVSSIGGYRLTPISQDLNTVESYNLLYVQGSFLGNLTHGLYKSKKSYSYFIFNAMTFGYLNGFGFQDNTIILGGSRRIFNTNQLSANVIVLNSYTYYTKVFKLKYWFEDYVKVSPTVTLTFKLSPSFGLNFGGTMTYRTDTDERYGYGALLGGRLSF